MSKRTVRDIEVEGKRVLVRVDFNVPLDRETLALLDDTRLRAVLPTVRYLVDKGARVILCSHLGRPGGKVVEGLRMAPVARRLSQLLGFEVEYARDCIGPEAERAVARLEKGQVLLLENLRFYPQEEENEPPFARALTRLADIYVNDAFGVAHRAHASTVGVAQYLPAVAGFLLEKEIEVLGQALGNPLRPFAALIGGAKVGDKMALLENILGRVDSLLIGGGMAATFLKARGHGVGLSAVEDVKLASRLMGRAEERGVRLLLPSDVVVAPSFEAGAPARTVAVGEVSQDKYIMDIGPQTVGSFEAELGRCKTIIWNGPLGVFEWAPFRQGTASIANFLASSPATTIIGGGSTAEAVEELSLTSRMTHVSTGGGAALEFLEGKTLPGVAALQDKGG